MRHFLRMNSQNMVFSLYEYFPVITFLSVTKVPREDRKDRVIPAHTAILSHERPGPENLKLVEQQKRERAANVNQLISQYIWRTPTRDGCETPFISSRLNSLYAS